jgi:hypothetical protein
VDFLSDLFARLAEILKEIALVLQLKNHPEELQRLIGAKNRVAIFHTANDEKVCSRCAPLEGYTFYFNWDGSLTPEDQKKFPPLHPRCRCPGRLEYKYV